MAFLSGHAPQPRLVDCHFFCFDFSFAQLFGDTFINHFSRKQTLSGPGSCVLYPQFCVLAPGSVLAWVWVWVWVRVAPAVD